MVPPWCRNFNFSAIREAAQLYRVEPEFLAALIQTESGGNQYAMRCEAKRLMNEKGDIQFVSLWRYFFEPDSFAALLGCTKATESIGQLTSYGPCQIMGAVAREWGFKGWFSELCSWDLGLEYACKHLRKKMDLYGSDPETLYSAFNGGVPKKEISGMFRNQVHVDHFMAFYREITSIQ